jgi:GNAT superfamily N-acetyltransferase
MTAYDQFTPSFSTHPMIQIMPSLVPLAAFYRFLYETVGAAWRWRDRLTWTDKQLVNWLAALTTQLFVLYVQGTPAGYIELDCQPDATEIAYFCLIPAFFGRGYGSHLLSYGIQWAWDSGAQRVWVHTCNLDGPHAIRTYQKVGFQVYRTEEAPMPDRYRDTPE